MVLDEEKVEICVHTQHNDIIITDEFDLAKRVLKIGRRAVHGSRLPLYVCYEYL
jgi:uncharacterized protein YaiI (UPF0178 family)